MSKEGDFFHWNGLIDDSLCLVIITSCLQPCSPYWSYTHWTTLILARTSGIDLILWLSEYLFLFLSVKRCLFQLLSNIDSVDLILVELSSNRKHVVQILPHKWWLSHTFVPKLHNVVGGDFFHWNRLIDDSLCMVIITSCLQPCSPYWSYTHWTTLIVARKNGFDLIFWLFDNCFHF